MLLGIRDSRFVQTIGVTSGSIGFGLLLCWAVDRWPGNPLASSALRGLSRIGFYSYPIYLWHLMVRLVVLACFGSRLLGFWAYIAGSIAAGAMVTQLMEQPFLRIRDRLFPGQAVALTPNSVIMTKETVHDPVLVPVSRNASNPT
jgi:peptidoglycan/LPS O-acetylase OafA/YrhL